MKMNNIIITNIPKICKQCNTYHFGSVAALEDNKGEVVGFLCSDKCLNQFRRKCTPFCIALPTSNGKVKKKKGIFKRLLSLFNLLPTN
jgi:hypothetical protein